MNCFCVRVCVCVLFLKWDYLISCWSFWVAWWINCGFVYWRKKNSQPRSFELDSSSAKKRERQKEKEKKKKCVINSLDSLVKFCSRHNIYLITQDKTMKCAEKMRVKWLFVHFNRRRRANTHKLHWMRMRMCLCEASSSCCCCYYIFS